MCLCLPQPRAQHRGGREIDEDATAGPDSQEIPGRTPLYRQVKGAIVKRLLGGVWQPGQVLPNEGKIAADFGVSQGTVRKALNELAAEGLVDRRQGVGTFVSAHDSERALFHFFRLREAGTTELRGVPVSVVCHQQPLTATAVHLDHLDVAAGDPLHWIRRLRYLSGNAAIVEDIVIPQALFPDLQLTPGSAFSDELYVLYQKTYAVTVHKTREAVRAGTASDAEAELLGIAAGAPMIEVDRIAVALDGSRVEWRVSRCRGAGYYYKNDIG